jgi:hypothetical protein
MEVDQIAHAPLAIASRPKWPTTATPAVGPSRRSASA